MEFLTRCRRGARWCRRFSRDDCAGCRCRCRRCRAEDAKAQTRYEVVQSKGAEDQMQVQEPGAEVKVQRCKLCRCRGADMEVLRC